MNPFKILIFAVALNFAFASDAPKGANLDADAARNQKEVKMLEAFCGSILPFNMASCMQLADKRLDESSAFYDRQKGLGGTAKSLRLEGRARLKACPHEASVRVGRESRMPKRR
jgi:hypothetical protein